jgi:hypothetical protein
MTNSPFHLTLCQNMMFFSSNIDGNMKRRYSFIIIGPQIDEETLNFHQKLYNNRGVLYKEGPNILKNVHSLDRTLELHNV